MTDALVRGVLAAALAGAMPAAADETIDALLARSRAVLADPPAQVGDLLASPPPSATPAERAALDAIAAASRESISAMPPAPAGRRFRLFVSQSMPAAELGDALAVARRHPDLAVVLRGVAPGQTLGQLQRRLLSLSDPLASGAPLPAIELDPPRFASAAIRLVPTLVCYDGDRELARVAGRIDPDWLAREVAGGRRGDFGTLGEVLAILEPDLMLALQQRAAGWDLAALRRDAESNYWRRREASALPVATRARRRRFDPSFVVTEDLRAPDGRPIATAGETVNPLARAPFTQRVVVFDGTDERQCALVRDWLRGAGDRRVTLVSSRWDAERGLDGLAALSRTLGRPVFLLGTDLIDRFRLEFVPSMVEADGLEFVVTEQVPGESR